MDIRDQIRDNEASGRDTYQCICLRSDKPDGCTYYRQNMPVKGMMRRDHELIWSIVPNRSVTDDLFYFSDLLFGLQISSFNTAPWPVWDWCSITNTKFAIDYNDDIFHIGSSNPADELDQDAAKAARQIIEHSNALSCTVLPMQDIIKTINSNVAIIPNYFDMSTFEYLFIPPEESEMRWKDRKKRTVVGYIGAANHTDDQDIFYDAMTQIMRERDDVDIAMFGTCPTKIEKEFGKSRVHVKKYTSLARYYPEFCQLEIDILCNPLLDTGFNACKSNIKWLEGSFFGAAVISSPIPAYKNLGDDICMIADWDEDEQVEMMNWRECIEHLIDNPQERFHRIALSQKWMAEEWDISIGYKNWLEYFKKVLNGESVAGLDYTPHRKEANDETMVQGEEYICAKGGGAASGEEIRISVNSECCEQGCKTGCAGGDR
jgi:hypothetical protein